MCAGSPCQHTSVIAATPAMPADAAASAAALSKSNCKYKYGNTTVDWYEFPTHQNDKMHIWVSAHFSNCCVWLDCCLQVTHTPHLVHNCNCCQWSYVKPVYCSCFDVRHTPKNATHATAGATVSKNRSHRRRSLLLLWVCVCFFLLLWCRFSNVFRSQYTFPPIRRNCILSLDNNCPHICNPISCPFQTQPFLLFHYFSFFPTLRLDIFNNAM